MEGSALVGLENFFEPEQTLQALQMFISSSDAKFPFTNYEYLERIVSNKQFLDSLLAHPTTKMGAMVASTLALRFARSAEAKSAAELLFPRSIFTEVSILCDLGFQTAFIAAVWSQSATLLLPILRQRNKLIQEWLAPIPSYTVPELICRVAIVCIDQAEHSGPGLVAFVPVIQVIQAAFERHPDELFRLRPAAAISPSVFSLFNSVLSALYDTNAVVKQIDAVRIKSLHLALVRSSQHILADASSDQSQRSSAFYQTVEAYVGLESLIQQQLAISHEQNHARVIQYLQQLALSLASVPLEIDESQFFSTCLELTKGKRVLLSSIILRVIQQRGGQSLSLAPALQFLFQNIATFHENVLLSPLFYTDFLSTCYMALLNWLVADSDALPQVESILLPFTISSLHTISRDLSTDLLCLIAHTPGQIPPFYGRFAGLIKEIVQSVQGEITCSLDSYSRDIMIRRPVKAFLGKLIFALEPSTQTRIFADLLLHGDKNWKIYILDLLPLPPQDVFQSLGDSFRMQYGNLALDVAKDLLTGELTTQKLPLLRSLTKLAQPPYSTALQKDFTSILVGFLCGQGSRAGYFQTLLSKWCAAKSSPSSGIWVLIRQSADTLIELRHSVKTSNLDMLFACSSVVADAPSIVKYTMAEILVGLADINQELIRQGSDCFAAVEMSRDTMSFLIRMFEAIVKTKEDLPLEVITMIRTAARNWRGLNLWPISNSGFSQTLSHIIQGDPMETVSTNEMLSLGADVMERSAEQCVPKKLGAEVDALLGTFDQAMPWLAQRELAETVVAAKEMLRKIRDKC